MAYCVGFGELWRGRAPLTEDCSIDQMIDLHCMSYTSNAGSEILVAGGQEQMFVLDVEKGVLKRQVRNP